MPIPSVFAPGDNHTAKARQSDGDQSLGRRALIAAGVLGAMGMAQHGARAAQPPGFSADIDPNALTVKMLMRTSFGLKAGDLDRARLLGYWGYINEQLALTEAQDNPAMLASLAGYTTLGLTGDATYTLNQTTLQRNELIEAAVLRAVESKRQLFEKMVEFWTDHFNIDINVNYAMFLKPIHDRDVIRTLALSTFPQLLLANAQSPAMLSYLSNETNTAAGPNENYGRELMELHTLGVGTGYTQADVRNVAKALTGWTLWDHTSTTDPALRGTFRYNDSIHDKSQKVVLGRVLPANRGIEDGLEVIDMLARDPRTAARIAKKLCLRFIGESCPQGHIDAVTRVYTATNGDIKSLIRAVLAPSAVWEAAPRYKRPFHFLASSLRAVPHTIISLSNMRLFLLNNQHLPFHWNPPDGYPDTFEYWRGNLLPRWNYGAMIAPGTPSSILVDTATFFSGCSSGFELAHRFDTTVMGGTMRPEDKQRIATYAGASNIDITVSHAALWLALGSPSFQWY